MKSLFILTSALNSRFGVYSPEQRLQQTLDSIASIRKYSPGSKIALVEMAGTIPTQEQVDILKSNVDLFYNFSEDEAVQGIYHSTDNWDVVKNTTEVMIFGNLLGELIENNLISEFDRVYKMSGRYLLTENFNPAYYETVPDRIVVLQRKTSQFDPAVTGGLTHQYMSRLWSWPANRTTEVVEAYSQGFLDMAVRIAQGGYFDIEHMLFKYLPANLVTEIPRVGLTGLLGPNGFRIED